MADLKNLTYGIEFNVNDNGMAKSLNIEEQIDSKFKSMAGNVEKVDSNINKMGQSTNNTNSKIKGMSDAFQTASFSATKTSNSTNKINESVNQSKKSANGLAEAFRNIHTNSNKSLDTVSRLKGTLTRLGIGIGVGEGVKQATNTYADFEQTMANVHATMGKISDTEMTKLWDAAAEAGAKTRFSATEAGNALYYLSSAGFDTQKSIAALNPLLDMASAGGIKLDRASELLTSAMVSAGVETKNLTMFTDQLAVAAQKTNTDIDQLLVGIGEVGGVAKQANMSTTDLSTELSILANAGKKGAEGGVGLRNVLLNLTAPNEKVAGLLKDLGIKILDTSGKIRPLNSILIDLRKSMSGFNEGTKMGILETIGGKENIESLNILLKGSGDQFENLKKQITDSKGAAKEMADVQNNTLKGSFDNLKSAIEGVTIKLMKDTGMGTWMQNMADALSEKGPAITNEIKFISDRVKDLGNFINDNIPNATGAIGGLVGALLTFQLVTTVLPIMGTVIGFCENLGLALIGLSTGTLSFTGALALFINPVTLIPLLIAGIVGAFIWWQTASEETKNKVVDTMYSIYGAIEEVINYAIESFNWLGKKINTVTSALNKVPVIGKMLDIPQIKEGEKLTTADDYFKKREEDKKKKAPGKAVGTRNSSSGLHLVGEYGPELINLPNASQVIPSQATTAILNQSTGANFADVVNNYDELVYKLLPTFTDYGKDINVNMSSGVDQSASNVTNSISNVTNRTANQLSTFAYSTNTYGNEIVNQIASGVSASEGNLTSVVQSLTDKVIQQFKSGFGIHSPSRVMFEIGDFLMQGLVNGMTAQDTEGFIKDWIGSMASTAGGAVSGNLAMWISTAMALTGVSADWFQPLATLIQHESGGDPFSINLWDWNAQMGHPSKGLMQLIDENMSDHHLPGMDNIYDPISNIAAGIRLIQHDYGTIYNVPGIRALAEGRSYVGYASGTNNATSGKHEVAENGMELIVGRQVRDFKGGEKVFNANTTRSMLSQDVPFGGGANNNIDINFSPSVNIEVNETTDAKATANEIDRILRGKFREMLDEQIETLRIQLGFVNINPA